MRIVTEGPNETPGIYVFDGSEYHGPFVDQDEANAFIAHEEREARLDDRHNNSLRHPN